MRNAAVFRPIRIDFTPRARPDEVVIPLRTWARIQGHIAAGGFGKIYDRSWQPKNRAGSPGESDHLAAALRHALKQPGLDDEYRLAALALVEMAEDGLGIKWSVEDKACLGLFSETSSQKAPEPTPCEDSGYVFRR
jgi:hypothetical protein